MDTETENSSNSKGPFYSRRIFLLTFLPAVKAVIAVIGLRELGQIVF